MKILEMTNLIVNDSLFPDSVKLSMIGLNKDVGLADRWELF